MVNYIVKPIQLNFMMDLNNKLYVKLVLGKFMMDLNNKLYVKLV